VCTVVAAFGLHAASPLVVLANRDEFLGRPSLPPRVIDPDAGIVGGVDATAHGTWLGVTRRGFLVAVTNQHTATPPDPHKASRGQLVLELLREGDPEAARARLASLDVRAFNPFNVLFGDTRSLFVGYARDLAAATIEPLTRGLHVLANDRIGSPRYPKAARALSLVEPVLSEPLDRLEGELARVLGDHAVPPPSALPASTLPPALARAIQALCIHTEHYGTRSSSFVALGPAPGTPPLRYLFADGPPCTTPFVDCTALF